jgi:nitrate/TMAO reductase-like tetraheme cytochrome c subunit
MRYVTDTVLLLFFAMFLPVTGAYADFRDLFEKEFVHKPWAGSTRIIEMGACVECHTSDIMKSDYIEIAQAWQMSIHFRYKVSCHDCHGGDPENPEVAMSHMKGFIGAPGPEEVPEFCGKCHIGVMEKYFESGHGRELKATGEGPNCVTCHGSHRIQQATIDIINEVLCTQCHTYERAGIMKKALFLTEKKLTELKDKLKELKLKGVPTEEEDKALFRTNAGFHIAFHSTDVSFVRKKADEFAHELNSIDAKLQTFFEELEFRKAFSVFFFVLFIGMSIVTFLLSLRYRD